MSDLDLTPEAVEVEAVRLCKLFGNEYHVAAMLRALSARLADAESRARESALDALAAYDQASDAYEAQIAAEASLADACKDSMIKGMHIALTTPIEAVPEAIESALRALARDKP